MDRRILQRVRAGALVAFGCLLLTTASAVWAQTLTVYDDELRNGFVDGYSYGGGTDLAHTVTTYDGSPFSIAFTGASSNAVAFPNETVDFSGGSWTGLRFQVHGGATGGQQLRLQLYNDLGGVPVAEVELDAFIDGGAIIANQWRQVDVTFAAFGFNGVFDRIDLQSDVPGNQPTLYLDQIELLGANAIFSDGFDPPPGPELLFVPQYNSGSLRIYQRDEGSFSLLRIAPLPAGTLANALAFAPDGKLWVLDNGAAQKRLLRFDRQELIDLPKAVPEVIIAPVGGNAGEVFDLAFFGDFLFVSLSDFGAAHRIVRYATSDLGASGNPAFTALTAGSLSIPAGLEFDEFGRLWISNYGNHTLQRMNASTGAIQRMALSVAVGARASLSAPEGLAFDRDGTLWVGNNGQPTISGYAAWQLDDAGLGSDAPVHLIDINPALNEGNTVGGLVFDRDGDLWANYQKTFAVLEYILIPGPRPGGDPGVGSYVSIAGQTLDAGSEFPGFGGLAIWPIPATTHLQRVEPVGTKSRACKRAD